MIRQFLEQLTPRQRQYVLTQLALGKNAYITINVNGICQRCGERYFKLQVKVTVNNVYFYHFNSTGKRCYLGPNNYIYVSLMNRAIAPLHGAIEQRRIINYIKRIEKYIKTVEKKEELEEIKHILSELESLVEFRLNELKQK